MAEFLVVFLISVPQVLLYSATSLEGQLVAAALGLVVVLSAIFPAEKVRGGYLFDTAVVVATTALAGACSLLVRPTIFSTLMVVTAPRACIQRRE